MEEQIKYKAEMIWSRIFLSYCAQTETKADPHRKQKASELADQAVKMFRQTFPEDNMNHTGDHKVVLKNMIREDVWRQAFISCFTETEFRDPQRAKALADEILSWHDRKNSDE